MSLILWTMKNQKLKNKGYFMQLFTATLLTTAYVASEAKELKSRNGGFLYINYTKGAESGLSIMVETTHEVPEDTPIWYQESQTDSSNNVTVVEHKIAATGKYKVPINCGIGDLMYKVSIKTTDSVVGVKGTASVFAKL